MRARAAPTGAPRIHAELAAKGTYIGRKRVARLMTQAGLAGVSRRRFVTTTAKDGGRQAPTWSSATSRRKRLIGCGSPTSPTFRPGRGFSILAVVLDAYSRRIVGWSMATTLAKQLVLDALNMALAARRPRGVIHHSDQGSQGGIQPIVATRSLLADGRRRFRRCCGPTWTSIAPCSVSSRTEGRALRADAASGILDKTCARRSAGGRSAPRNGPLGLARMQSGSLIRTGDIRTMVTSHPEATRGHLRTSLDIPRHKKLIKRLPAFAKQASF